MCTANAATLREPPQVPVSMGTPNGFFDNCASCVALKLDSAVASEFLNALSMKGSARAATQPSLAKLLWITGSRDCSRAR